MERMINDAVVDRGLIRSEIFFSTFLSKDFDIPDDTLALASVSASFRKVRIHFFTWITHSWGVSCVGAMVE